MKLSAKHSVKYLIGVILLLYPVLVFCALVVFKLAGRSLGLLSIVLILFAVAYLILNIHGYKGKKKPLLFISPAILCAIGVACLVTSFSVESNANKVILKLYPLLADIAYITIFGTSLFIPPPLVYYFTGILNHPDEKKLGKEKFDRFCYRATAAWCIFFVIDAVIAGITTLGTVSDKVWGLYNGVITYALMGLILVGEFVILKLMEKRAAASAGALDPEKEHDHC